MLVHGFIRISILIPQTNYCLSTVRLYVTLLMTVCFLIDILIKSFLISRRSQVSELRKTQNW